MSDLDLQSCHPASWRWKSLAEAGPSLSEAGQSLEEYGPSLEKSGPSIADSGPSLNESGPSLVETGPRLSDPGPCVLKRIFSNRTRMPSFRTFPNNKSNNKHKSFTSRHFYYRRRWACLNISSPVLLMIVILGNFVVGNFLVPTAAAATLRGRQPPPVYNNNNAPHYNMRGGDPRRQQTEPRNNGNATSRYRTTPQRYNGSLKTDNTAGTNTASINQGPLAIQETPPVDVIYSPAGLSCDFDGPEDSERNGCPWTFDEPEPQRPGFEVVTGEQLKKRYKKKFMKHPAVDHSGSETGKMKHPGVDHSASETGKRYKKKFMKHPGVDHSASETGKIKQH